MTKRKVLTGLGALAGLCLIAMPLAWAQVSTSQFASNARRYLNQPVGLRGLYYANREEFAAALRTVMTNDRLRESLGQSGRRYVQQHYRWESVVGRFDRETIECVHTMEAHSLARHWPVLLSRLEKAGLEVVERPGSAASEE